MSDSIVLLCHSEDRIDQLEQEVFTNTLNDRINHLKKKVKKLRKELEKEMHDNRFYREKYEPEKESPPFKSWVK